MTRSERSESELVSLRKLASELAQSRKERPTTVHLLAAIASRPGTALDLLGQRSLDRDAILKASRSFDEDDPGCMTRVLGHAREVAKRARGQVSTDLTDRGHARISPDSKLVHVEPAALHVLVALLADRRSAAHRALELAGIDVSRLRTVALSHALGVVSARPDRKGELSPAALRPKRPAGAVVPLASLRGPRVATGQTEEASRPSDQEVMLKRARPARIVSTTPRVAPKVEAPKVTLATALPAALRPTSSHVSKLYALAFESDNDARVGAREPELDPREFPRLAALTKQAAASPAFPSVGREPEVEQALEILGKHRANTPCLVGPAGVGKTSLARALAAALRREHKTLLEVPISELIGGANARGAMAERLGSIFDEALRAQPRVVLLFDDVDELLASEEACIELKQRLSRGGVPVVLCTSSEGYRRTIEPDAQLARRVVPVEVEPPDEAGAFLMVRASSDVIALHHGVEIRDEAIACAVSWSIRYLPGRALPDKAVSVIDHTAARVRRGHAAGVGARAMAPVDPEAVARTLSELADVPIERLLETDRDRLLALDVHLGKRVVGHTDALGRIAAQLRKSAAGLRGRRPLGSFLLLGPTGVGKTETAKALAEALFGAPDAMTRLDLSEFAESHALARLIGAPPGYVGHEAGGQLTEALRKRPYQVVLLDEIEKAHQDVLLTFLQVLDEGHLSDGRGRRVDFTNAVIVMTSNLGSREMLSAKSARAVGFAQTATPPPSRLAEMVIDVAKKRLPIELYNRIDEVLFFSPLGRDEIAEVARQALAQLADTLLDRGIQLQVDDGIADLLLDLGGYDPELGARPLKRTLARLVEAPLAELMLRGEVESGSIVMVGVEDGKVVVDAMTPAPRVGGASRAARSGSRTPAASLPRP